MALKCVSLIVLITKPELQPHLVLFLEISRYVRDILHCVRDSCFQVPDNEVYM